MRRSILLLLAAVLSIGPAAVPAFGQFRQYTQPGILEIGGAGIDRELLEDAVTDARWRLGPLRVDPWLTIRDAAWYEADEIDGGDFTVTGGAGLRAYLRSGPDVFWLAHLLPEYVWWLEQDERRQLVGRYGAALLAYFNRLETSVRVTRAEQQEVVSVEFPERVDFLEEAIAVAASLDVGRVTSVFADVNLSRLEHRLRQDRRAGGPPLELLDREEQAVRAGVRYEPRPGLSIGGGVELTRTDSLDARRDLSNEGTSPFLEVVLDGRRLRLDLAAGFLSLDPQPGSEFVPFEDVTAEGGLTLRGNRAAAALYGRRTLSPALAAGYPYYVTEVAGLSVDLRVASRTTLRGYGETGEARFERTSGGLPPRTDDLAAYGLQATIQLGRSLSFTAGYSEARFESFGDERTISQLRAGLAFGAGRSPWY